MWPSQAFLNLFLENLILELSEKGFVKKAREFERVIFSFDYLNWTLL